MFILFIHGKLSKKSNTTYRVRNNKQQCYQLTPSTKTATAKQTIERQIFKQTNALVWADLKKPMRKAHWEQVAASSNIPNYTARKAAFAHYKAILNTTSRCEVSQRKSPKKKQPRTCHPVLQHRVSQQIHLHHIITITKRDHIHKQRRTKTKQLQI